MAKPVIRERPRAAALAELGGERGNDLEQIADQAVVGDLEDGRFGILVDSNDDFAVLHAGEVLDGAGDAHRYVKIRSDDLACLPDLIVVGNVTRVNGRP